MTLAATNFYTIDFWAFESLAEQELKGLFQWTVDIDVTSNKWIMIDDLLCQPITVKCNIKARAMKQRDIMAKHLIKHIDTAIFMANIIDLWTNNIRKLTYIYFTTHYINEEFALFDQRLHVKPIRDETHITVKKVMNKFKKTLDIFDIKDFMFDRIIVVMGCELNIAAKDDISNEFD